MLKLKRKEVAEIPNASLADIAFLILTFFLLTTTISTDKGLRLTLPVWGDQLNVPKKNICNVFINPSGQIMVAEQEIPLTLLQDNIRKRLVENLELIISIKPSKDTEYNIFVEVLDQIKLAGAEKISIAELEK